jgi:type VI secretion system protein ImpG
MINPYYQRELAHLRELAVEFSKAHPALAPMLSGPTQDPDVERLLEGTAFLTGLLRQKLDDEFPEVIHGLMSLIFPHYLRPLPSTTIIKFAPKPSLMETINVPAGTALASVPVDGVKCTFRTSYDVLVHPMDITGVRFFEQPGRPSSLTLSFKLTSTDLTNWKAGYVRLYLAGSYSEAANIFYLLFYHVAQITISSPQGGLPLVVDPDRIKRVGLEPAQSLLPYPPQSFPGYRVLQEYFILPEKFLFVDITGLDDWKERGSGTEFEFTFVMKDLPTIVPRFKKENFVLFATPAVNLFPHDGDPISLDHRQPEYRVMPSGKGSDAYQVYSVEKVTGFAPGTVKRREFAPYELFAPQSGDTPIYYTQRKLSAIRPTSEVYLSVSYPSTGGPPAPETLSIELMCTNSSLPENLKYGDITEPTSTSPELCSFTNIRPPTAVVQPPLGKNLLWRFLSHVSLNLLSLANKENLKVLLRLYVFPDGRDRSAILANEKRIEGIMDLKVVTVDRLVKGLTMRGQEIQLGLNTDNFASQGDMFLFSSVMDHFLGTYASINCFTSLTVVDSLKGDTYQWPFRMGDRPLI